MQEVMSIDFRNTFPVFPLTDCVLLPNALIPLHVFESRYRQMVSEALDSFGLIAMAMFQHDVTADEYFRGTPELRPYVGLGHIRHYERLRGDCYIVILQGVCRARILGEPVSRSYRRIRLQPVDVSPHDETQMSWVRKELESLVEGPPLSRLEPLQDLKAAWPSETVSTSALVDLIAAKIANDTEKKYGFLAEPSLVRRAGLLMGYLWALRNSLTEET